MQSMSGPYPSEQFPNGQPPLPVGRAAADLRSANATSHVEDAGDQIRDLFDIILRGKWIILATILCVTIPVTLYMFNQPNQYQAFNILLIKPDGGTPGLPSEIADALGGDSREMGDEVLVLQQGYELAMNTAAELLERGVAGGKPLTILAAPKGGEASQETIANRLKSYLTVRAIGKVNAIMITAESTLPEEAALIPNLYAEQYLRRTMQQNRSGAVAARSFLEDQVEKRAGELEGLEDDLRGFMTREGAVALDQESANVVQQLSDLEARRDETAIEIEMKRAALAATRDDLETIQPNLAARIASGVNRELEAAQQKKADLEVKLEQIYLRNPELRTNPSPEVAELQGQVEQLRDRLYRLSSQYVDEVLAVNGMDPENPATGLSQVAELRRTIARDEIELSGMEAQRDVLTSRIRDYEGELRSIPRQAIELAQLQRSRQATERIYLFLTEKLQETRIAEESQTENAEILRPAQVPGAPFAPNRLRNILAAAFASLLLGAGLAIAKTKLDHRIHRPEELRELGLPLTGIVPSMAKIIKKDFKGQDTIQEGPHTYATTLVTLLNPLSPISEAYRGIRTNIQFSRPDTLVQTVLVTSPNPSEGKSTTAMNLAVTMAQSDRRVLLIDADLRRPTLHKRFGLPREPGLRQLIFDDDALSLQSENVGIENLHVLTAGSIAPNPSELVSSKRMRDLLDRFKREFDVVIVDVLSRHGGNRR